MRKILYLLSSIIVLIACREKEIEYDLPFEGEKLVVISLLNPDEIFSAKISHTWAATGSIPQNSFVNDAFVQVFEDGKLKEQLMLQKEGYYVSNKATKPILGHKYSIVVSSPKYSEVSSAEVQIPEGKPRFTYEQIADVSYKYNKDTPRDGINVMIQDDPSKQNYYAINFDLMSKSEYDMNIYYGYGSAFYLDDGDVETNQECSFRQTIYHGTNVFMLQVFASQCFSSSTPNFHFAVDKGYNRFYVNNQKIYEKIENPVISVYQFDKAYFEYLKLLKQPNGLFELAFSEPHTTYTNIKGGYGIVGAFTTKSEKLTMTCKICK